MENTTNTASIYLIVIKDTCEQYVGKTIKPTKVRIHHHTHTNQFVDRKMRAHGYDWCVLEKCRPEDTEYLEKYYIDLFNTNYDLGFGGLNLTCGGERCFTTSEASKLKMSKSLKEYYANPKNRERQSRIQQEIWSREGMREKVSKKSIEMWNNPEHRKKIMEIYKSQHYLIKKSAACKNAWAKPSHYAKMCILRQKVWNSQEYHKKMSLAHINSKRCNEFRKKVVQLTKDGVFVREYESLAAAAKEMGLVSYTCILHCCAGRYKTSKGFKWMYYEDYVKEILNRDR